jgi:adenylate kinase family enzyme
LIFTFSVKIALINYPTEEKQVEELHSELAQMGLKITEVLLCNPSNYELMADIQNKYLLCPKCEKTFARATTIDENKEFTCPRDNEKYALTKVNKFSETRLANYFKNSGKVVEKILGENKQKFPFFHKLDISQEKEIVSGELVEKISKVINSL